MLCKPGLIQAKPGQLTNNYNTQGTLNKELNRLTRWNKLEPSWQLILNSTTHLETDQG